MTETQKKKNRFRQSVKWKKFRHQKNVEQNGLCFVTKKKLLKLSNLHHCDLDEEHYEDISNPDNFVFVNKSIHDVIHTLYRYYAKDPEVLDRLKIVLDRMVLLNIEERKNQ